MSTLRKLSLIIIILLGLITVVGSGGGGSPVPDGNPNGIYSGIYTELGVTYNLAAVVVNGRFVGISTDAGTIQTGSAIVSGNSLTGSLSVLQIGGGLLYTSTLSATFVEGQSISGTITGGGSTATFSLSMDTIYNRTPNTNLAGTYSVTSGAYTFTVTTDNAGSYTASDTDGCTYSGTQAAYDSTHNLYQLGVTVANCGVSNGTYTGYSFNDDISVANDALVWVIDDPAFILILVMLRQ